MLTLLDQSGNIFLPLRGKQVDSAYAELRAPLAPADIEFIPLRGLEVQLAGRFDRTAITLPDNALAGAPSNDRLITLSHGAAVFTAGARILPLPALMLRASVATGELPPTITQLHAQANMVTALANRISDPKRGNQTIGVDGAYTLLTDGSHTVKPEEGRTVTLGVVINPSGRGGPRVLGGLFAHRDGPRDQGLSTYARSACGRRGDLSRPGRAGPADRGGHGPRLLGRPILQLDTGAINAGGTVVEAVDVKADWVLPAGAAGDFRIYGSGTWQPTYLRRAALGSPASDRVGFADGPLSLRGNAGVEWARGPVAVDFNAQYFDGYRVTNADEVGVPNSILLSLQGASRIPHQLYFDLSARRRFEVWPAGRLSVLEIRAGILNLFDQGPPIITDPNQLGFSPYADPRGRRVEVAISSKF